MILFYIIRAIYALYVLICRRDLFEEINSPLNHYGSILGKIIYCAKLGIFVSSGTLTFLVGGIAYDEILVASNIPKRFLPLMVYLYNNILGEIDPINPNSIQDIIDTNNSENTIINLITRFEKLDENSKKEFLALIKKDSNN